MAISAISGEVSLSEQVFRGLEEPSVPISFRKNNEPASTQQAVFDLFVKKRSGMGKPSPISGVFH